MMEVTMGQVVAAQSNDLQVIEGGNSVNNPGSKAWSSKIRKRAKQLVQELDTGYIELAKILYQVWDTPMEGDPNRGPVFKEWGYTSLGQYAEEELGLHRKKAERLRAIWYTLEVELVHLDKAKKDRVIALGASKVRELIRVIDETNIDQWCDLAEKSSYPVLCASISKAVDQAKIQKLQATVSAKEKSIEAKDTKILEAYAKGGGVVAVSGEGSFDEEEAEELEAAGGDVFDPGSPKRMKAAPLAEPESLEFEHFALYPDQHLNVKLALQKAGQMSGSDKKSHNLDLICTSFLATNDIIPANIVENRVRFMHRLESIFGVKIIALDEQSKEVVFGVGTLARLATPPDDD